MRRGGEGGGRAGAAGRKRKGWRAGRGLRTWAERPNAGPHVGEKYIVLVFPKKTQNLGFRVFFRTLLVRECQYPHTTTCY
jgi:hypothetical protein